MSDFIFYTGTNTFPATIASPLPNTPLTAQSVQSGTLGLANRTTFLNTRITTVSSSIAGSINLTNTNLATLSVSSSNNFTGVWSAINTLTNTDLSQLTNDIQTAQNTANSALSTANSAVSVNNTQNNTLTSHNSRITSNEADIVNLFVASGSFSTRVTSNTTLIGTTGNTNINTAFGRANDIRNNTTAFKATNLGTQIASIDTAVSGAISVNNTQNTNITNAQSTASSALATANSAVSVNNAQNTRLNTLENRTAAISPVAWGSFRKGSSGGIFLNRRMTVVTSTGIQELEAAASGIGNSGNAEIFVNLAARGLTILSTTYNVIFSIEQSITNTSSFSRFVVVNNALQNSPATKTTTGFTIGLRDNNGLPLSIGLSHAANLDRVVCNFVIYGQLA